MRNSGSRKQTNLGQRSPSASCEAKRQRDGQDDRDSASYWKTKWQLRRRCKADLPAVAKRRKPIRGERARTTPASGRSAAGGPTPWSPVSAEARPARTPSPSLFWHPGQAREAECAASEGGSARVKARDESGSADRAQSNLPTSLLMSVVKRAEREEAKAQGAG